MLKLFVTNMPQLFTARPCGGRITQSFEFLQESLIEPCALTFEGKALAEFVEENRNRSVSFSFTGHQRRERANGGRLGQVTRSIRHFRGCVTSACCCRFGSEYQLRAQFRTDHYSGPVLPR